MKPSAIDFDEHDLTGAVGLMTITIPVRHRGIGIV